MVIGKFGSSRVMLMPANPGTGVIAGATVRAVADALGIRDLLTKCRGSTNPLNVIKATFAAVCALRSRSDIMSLRGV
jgi:small subunit ribosomal protein S5